MTRHKSDEKGPGRAPTDELTGLDATGLADLVRKKQLSASELLNVVLDRIEALNPTLNFMTTPTFDRARRVAQNVTPESAFCGVPFLMKDMIDIGGVTRTDGSRLMASNVPERNVAYVDAIEAAGLNIVGLTNTPEFAGGFSCSNDLFGVTLNPWNLDYSPLVSSGGSAAAVAAGVVPMAHGTDGAGSNRLPASACGLFGMKPSRNRMLSGEADGSHDLTKTNQVISRSVRDSAILFDLTEDKSGTDFEPAGAALGPSVQRLTIAAILEPPEGLKIESEVLDAVRDTAVLLEQLGHTVIPTEWPVDTAAYLANYPAYFAQRLAPLKTMIEAMTGGTLR